MSVPKRDTRTADDAQAERIINSANWSPQRKLAERREVARRYAWTTEQAPRPNSGNNASRLLSKIRLREIERLFHHRYGNTLPDDDDGRDSLELVAHHIAHLRGEVEAHIVAWASLWCPWMPAGEVVAVAERVAAYPMRFKADTLAWRLGLKMSARMALGITTIGAVDMNAADRLERRNALKRDRERRRRAARRTGKARGRPRKNACPAGTTIIAGHAFSARSGTAPEGRRALEGRAPILGQIARDLARLRSSPSLIQIRAALCSTHVMHTKVASGLAGHGFQSLRPRRAMILRGKQ